MARDDAENSYFTTESNISPKWTS